MDMTYEMIFTRHGECMHIYDRDLGTLYSAAHPLHDEEVLLRGCLILYNRLPCQIFCFLLDHFVLAFLSGVMWQEDSY